MFIQNDKTKETDDNLKHKSNFLDFIWSVFVIHEATKTLFCILVHFHLFIFQSFGFILIFKQTAFFSRRSLHSAGTWCRGEYDQYYIIYI